MNVSVINDFEKRTVTSDGSNILRVWGEPPAARGQRGFGSGTPNAVAIFLSFSKNKAFLCMFSSKFLLRNVFLNDCKVRC